MTTAPLVCIQCLYTLTGLPAESVCPECATPIRRSIDAQFGAFPSPERLRPAGRVVNALLFSIYLPPALVLLGFLLFSSIAGDLGIFLNTGLLLLCWVVWHLGWIWLASIDPTVALDERVPRSNRALRLVSIPAGLTPLALLAFGSLQQDSFPVSAGVVMLGGVMLVLLQITLAAPMLSRIATTREQPHGHGKRLRDMPVVRLAAVEIGLVGLMIATHLLSNFVISLAGLAFLLFIPFAAILLALLVVLIGALITARAAMRAALAQRRYEDQPP